MCVCVCNLCPTRFQQLLSTHSFGLSKITERVPSLSRPGNVRCSWHLSGLLFTSTNQVNLWVQWYLYCKFKNYCWFFGLEIFFYMCFNGEDRITESPNKTKTHVVFKKFCDSATRCRCHAVRGDHGLFASLQQHPAPSFAVARGITAGPLHSHSMLGLLGWRC